MGNEHQSYMALFDTVDYPYSQEPNDPLAVCAGDFNPYLWESEESADPAAYPDFRKAFLQEFPDSAASKEEARRFLRSYLFGLSMINRGLHPHDPDLQELFDRHIADAVWNRIWDRAADEVEDGIGGRVSG